MGYNQIEKVVEETNVDNVNKLLSEGWQLINVTPATDESGAHFLYCLGWIDPIVQLCL